MDSIWLDAHLFYYYCSSKEMRYPADMPSHLSHCVQNVLLATLLQPSTVFLALWYMVRLPVYFGAAPLNSEIMKAAAGFQTAFLNNAQQSYEHEAAENSTPLRLVVLGFMLANKWLDDHTFSNKTWCVILIIGLFPSNMYPTGTPSLVFRFKT